MPPKKIIMQNGALGGGKEVHNINKCATGQNVIVEILKSP